MDNSNNGQKTMGETIPETASSEERGNIIERPDGFYWEDRSDGKLYGPFPTLLEAMQDMQYEADSSFEEGESLEEAEAEIGISDWIDPDTGAPAENSAPHLNTE
jgi:hypothetical protein